MKISTASYEPFFDRAVGRSYCETFGGCELRDRVVGLHMLSRIMASFNSDMLMPHPFCLAKFDHAAEIGTYYLEGQGQRA